MRMIKWGPIVFLMIIIVLPACNTAKNTFRFVPSDKFLFIEYIQVTEGKQLSGIAPKGLRIDGPTYNFNHEKMELTINRKTNFSFDTVKAVIGTGKVFKGAAGSGVSTYIKTMQSLPFILGDLKIEKIDENGIRATHNSKPIFLKTGEGWEDSFIKLDTLNKEENIIIELSTKYTLHYWGLVEKKAIKY